MHKSQIQADSRSSSKRRMTPRDARSSTRKPPPNYFSRKEQYRLLILCSMLMFVLAMMNEARKPETWNWLWSRSTEAVTNSQVDPIDTKINQPSIDLPPDGFTAVSPLKREQIPIDRAGYVTGITPRMLASIEDNTVLRAAENEAWLAMFHILSEKTQAEIVSLSTAKVGFAQLFRQTDTYRGRVVTVVGTVRRLESIQLREKHAGVEQLFRWIVEPAGGSNAPIVIYSLETPDGFPTTEDLREDATFTGFCFKRWAYAAGDGTRVAPLLLAKTATWQPPPPASPRKLPSMPVVASILVGMACLCSVFAFVVYRSSISERPEVARIRRSTAGGIDQLNNEDVLPSVSEMLEQMAEPDRESEDRP